MELVKSMEQVATEIVSNWKETHRVELYAGYGEGTTTEHSGGIILVDPAATTFAGRGLCNLTLGNFSWDGEEAPEFLTEWNLSMEIPGRDYVDYTISGTVDQVVESYLLLVLQEVVALPTMEVVEAVFGNHGMGLLLVELLPYIK